MEFSVVIPTFNRAAILERTLLALERQRFEPESREGDGFEVIVVDDGSTDDTGRRVRTLQSSCRMNLRYFHQENQLQGAARNLGSRHAAGDYLVFLGDDTAPDDGFLEAHRQAHRREPEEVAVIGYTPWAADPPPTRFMQYVGEHGWQFGFALIQDARDVPFNFLYTANLSLPRRRFLACGGFDEGFKEYGWEDVELGWRLKQQGLRLVYQPCAVARHHHPTSIASFIRRQRKVGYSAWTLYRKHPDLAGFLGLDRLPRHGPLDRLKMTLLTWACRLTEHSRRFDLSRYYPDLMTYHYCRGALEGRHADE